MSDPRMIPADEARAMRELLPGDLDLAEYDMFDRMAKWLPYYKTYAAAPDLAHTVIEQAAQIERVREELKALRDYYIDREARSRERLESATDEREQFQFARFEHMHRRAHEALTRILEGDTDD